MAPQLAPCPGCSQHLRINEQRCPFCSKSLTIVERGSAMGILREQAAAVLMGASLALAACSTQAPSAPNDQTEVKPVPLDERPAETQPGAALAPASTPAPTSAPTSLTSPPPGRVLAPIYGAPPRPAMKYGAPPPRPKPKIFPDL